MRGPLARAVGVLLVAAQAYGCAGIEPSTNGQDSELRSYDESEDALAAESADVSATQHADEAPVLVASNEAGDQLAEAAAAAAIPTPTAQQESAVVAASKSCEHDRDCAPSEYCSQSEQVCRTRCDAQQDCVGPAIAVDNNRVVSDGARVCYAAEDLPGTQSYALRVWDGVAADATTLTVATDVRALLLADGYCYFHGAGALRRAALSGGCVELVQEMATPPAQLSAGAQGVSWSAGQGEQRASYRIARTANARAERLAASPDLAPSANGNASGETGYQTFAVLDQRLIHQHATKGRLAVAPVALMSALTANAGAPAL